MQPADMETSDPETPANGAPEAACNEVDDDDLPTTGFLSFYDRLRDRLAEEITRRGGKLGSHVAEVLLLIPDVFMLLVRLTFDREVPKKTRLLLASVLAYFVMPVDLLPELTLGATGFIEDLVLAVAVLQKAFGSELEPYADKYWSGSQPLRQVLADILEAATSLLDYNVLERMRSLLRKRGIDLDDVTAEAVESA